MGNGLWYCVLSNGNRSCDRQGFLFAHHGSRATEYGQSYLGPLRFVLICLLGRKFIHKRHFRNTIGKRSGAHGGTR